MAGPALLPAQGISEMDNPYEPPEALARTGLDLAEPSSMFDRGLSIFLTTVISLAGACVVQVAGLIPMLVAGRAPVPPDIYSLLWVWFAVSGFAACCGLHGGYRARRRASVGNLSLLAFLSLYSVTARFGDVSFGWPFQLNVGMVFGQFGLGLNVVGIGMLVWWLVSKSRETSRAAILGIPFP